jgi:hypothetical protein
VRDYFDFVLRVAGFFGDIFLAGLAAAVDAGLRMAAIM